MTVPGPPQRRDIAVHQPAVHRPLDRGRNQPSIGTVGDPLPPRGRSTRRHRLLTHAKVLIAAMEGQALTCQGGTMNKQPLVRAALFLALPCTLLGAAIPSAAGTGAGGKHADAGRVAWMGSVPKAHCGPGDHTESGLQGQTTPQERSSGDSERAYNCNLQLVGQFQGEGNYSQDGPTYYGTCAYYGTDHVTALQLHPGMTVIDASDPQHPTASAYLNDSPAALAPHETPKVHAQRG